MGRDSIEFDWDELRIVGGDYGQVVLEGATEEARREIDTIVASTRRGSDRTRFVHLEVECDDTPDKFEDRHAGRESEIQIDFVTEPVERSEDEEGPDSRGPGHRPDASGK